MSGTLPRELSDQIGSDAEDESMEISDDDTDCKTCARDLLTMPTERVFGNETMTPHGPLPSHAARMRYLLAMGFRSDPTRSNNIRIARRTDGVTQAVRDRFLVMMQNLASESKTTESKTTESKTRDVSMSREPDSDEETVAYSDSDSAEILAQVT